MRTASLPNIKRLKDATGGTVNDVVMAICAGALREYLLAHDALPDRPLRAMVPVSIRTGEEDDPWTNRVSALVVDLPTDVRRPARACRPLPRGDARRQAAVRAGARPRRWSTCQQFSSPVLATSAIRLAARLRLADRVAPPFNVVISNVPGPASRCTSPGPSCVTSIPVSTIADGQGLNITVHSYLDRLDFGLIADRELVPDLWDLVDMHIDEIGRLFDATGAEWAQPPQPAVPRRGPVKQESTR